jgi:anti-sigma factor RsiW
MDARTTELLNLELDGRLDVAGRAELGAHLAADPAARARRAGLQAVARALAQAEAPELPADFHDELLRRALVADVAVQPAPRRRRPRQWAYALAASVVVAVLAFQFVERREPVAPEQVSGTMAPVDAPSVTIEATAPQLVLRFRLPASPAAQLVIDVPGEGVISAAADGAAALRVEGRRIVVSGFGSGALRVRVAGVQPAQEFRAVLVSAAGTTPVMRIQSAGRHRPQ